MARHSHLSRFLKACTLFAMLVLTACASDAPTQMPRAPVIESNPVVRAFLDSRKTETPAREYGVEQGYGYGDMDGDGVDELALVWTTMGGAHWRNNLTVFSKGADGVYVAVNTLPLEGLAHFNGISNGVVHIDQMVYGEEDPLCCPSLPEAATYDVDGTRIFKNQGGQ